MGPSVWFVTARPVGARPLVLPSATAPTPFTPETRPPNRLCSSTRLKAIVDGSPQPEMMLGALRGEFPWQRSWAWWADWAGVETRAAQVSAHLSAHQRGRPRLAWLEGLFTETGEFIQRPHYFRNPLEQQALEPIILKNELSGACGMLVALCRVRCNQRTRPNHKDRRQTKNWRTSKEFP